MLLLLACVGTEESTPPTLVDTAPPYTAPTAQWDGEQAAAAAQAVLDARLPVGHEVIDAWRAMVDQGATADCPDRVAYSMLDAPFGCDAGNGYYFSGMTALRDEMDDGGRELLCDAYVVDPNGDTFVCGGEVLMLAQPETPDFLWVQMIGTFGYEGHAPWEQGARSVALWAQTFPSAGDLSVHFNGSIDTPQGALYFRELGFDMASGEVFQGAVGVRSDHGWYASVLGPKGCGAWIYEGGPAVGQGCVDLNTPIQLWRHGTFQ